MLTFETETGADSEDLPRGHRLNRGTDIQTTILSPGTHNREQQPPPTTVGCPELRLFPLTEPPTRQVRGKHPTMVDEGEDENPAGRHMLAIVGFKTPTAL